MQLNIHAIGLKYGSPCTKEVQYLRFCRYAPQQVCSYQITLRIVYDSRDEASEQRPLWACKWYSSFVAACRKGLNAVCARMSAPGKPLRLVGGPEL